MIQGLSLGGEYGTSATYLSEVADEKNRGFYSSFQYVTLIGGQLSAILVLLVLQLLLTGDQLRAWGWRVPFVIGALLAVTALAMRSGLHETEEFVASKAVGRAAELGARAVPIPARSADGHRVDDGGTSGVLHLHDLHAEVPQAVGRADGWPDDAGHRRSADLRACCSSRCTARFPIGSAASRCSSGSG